MNDQAPLWADPRLVYPVAVAAVALLLVTLWLFGRRKRQGRQAAVICLMLSIALHLVLIFLVPMLQLPGGGASNAEAPAEPGNDSIQFSAFDPDAELADASSDRSEPVMAPLPVADLTDVLREQADDANQAESADVAQAVTPTSDESPLPESLANDSELISGEFLDSLDSELADLLEQSMATAAAPPATAAAGETPREINTATGNAQPPAVAASPVAAAPAIVPGALQNDFANRAGAAKQEALLRNGGSIETEAAVEAALRFLAASQRSDGAWDPRASGAGRENGQILGVRRPGTGAHAESALTGLALLTLMGAGHTHQEGPYADNVYRGLAYLIRNQKPNGSLAGGAANYAATYSHGMAALAICEAAAITRDAAAIDSARRAIGYTVALQHPNTGGWRYLPNDPGDLSQLGWQAMVLDAGHRAQIPASRRSVAGVQRFLRSVRAGQAGGLACYRPGDAPSRTMTAEALATRLLIGDTVSAPEIAEAERYLLQQPPGVGKDNYYYWYYATLALHQLQDDAWQRWNAALKRRLIATQRPEGSWPANTVWGGYGGTVYTTAMGTLCLESYYRHAVRKDAGRIARLPQP